MAALRESVTTTDFADAETNPDFAMPATRPDGDLYLLFAGSDGDTALTVPSGWTPIEAFPNPSNNTFYVLTGYRVGSSEPASYNLGGTPDAGGSIHVIRYSGADTESPINASGFDRADTGTSLNAPSVTPDVDDTVVVRLYLHDGANINSVPNEVFIHNSTLDSLGTAMGEAAGPAAGNPAGIVSASGNNDNWGAVTIAIAPAAAPAAAGMVFPPKGRRFQHMMVR